MACNVMGILIVSSYCMAGIVEKISLSVTHTWLMPDIPLLRVNLMGALIGMGAN